MNTTLRKTLPVLLVLLTLFGKTNAAAATVVKMATLVPEGSVWDRILRDMAADWAKLSNGQVELRIYAGGVAGDEPDVVRKMRIGQIHAAAFSITGLITLDPGFEIFQIPMFFESWEELFAVLEVVRPELEKRLEAKGYVFLQWGHGGWVHMFSSKEIKKVEDLRGQKVFTWAGNDSMTQLWRSNGFQPVALAATDITTGLQTGMLEAVPTTPLAALSLQWFRQTPFMQQEGLAPLVGATVISKKIWDGLPAELRDQLRASAKKIEQRLDQEVPDQDRQAIEQMKQRGLKVTPMDEASRGQWHETANQFAGAVQETLKDRALFDLALKARDAYRAKAGKMR
jgi:TRAP-type transport system periplasmic protein